MATPTIAPEAAPATTPVALPAATGARGVAKRLWSTLYRILSWTALAVLLVLWEILAPTGVIEAQFLPAPSTVHPAFTVVAEQRQAA